MSCYGPDLRQTNDRPRDVSVFSARDRTLGALGSLTFFSFLGFSAPPFALGALALEGASFAILRLMSSHEEQP
jgi:hypothetical protein